MSINYTSVEMSQLGVLVGRNPDGTGNNLINADWGSVNTTYLRVTENSYADGISSIDATLPNVKSVSDAMFDLGPDEQEAPNKAGHNENVVFFGQLFTHDIAFTAGGPVPFPDPTFPFGVRNGSVIEDGVAQQINTKTSFLDLSMIYGVSQAVTDRLTDGARMILGPDDLLPTANEIDNSDGLLAGPFFTGDQRANQTPQLLSQQLIWARNHNWHVDQLEAKYGDYWTDEQIFNAARALNEAEWQNVVFSEYFTKLFGDKALGKYKGYDAYVDPSIINEYTAVANRFGHDQSSNTHIGQDENGAVVFTKSLAQSFGDGFAGLANSSAILDQWMRGQLSRVSQETDGKVVDGNRELLFGVPLDLEAVDIGRGRDHGAGNYNALRDGLGLKKYNSIDEFAHKNNVSAEDKAALKALYGDDINRVDSIVGTLLEKDAKGSVLGETLTKISVMQFQALRDGDRFYFENQFKGNDKLIEAIKDTSFADIIARNTDIDHVYHDAFAAHERIGGGDGKDVLQGGDKGDLVIGFGGHDQLKGWGGADDVWGGDGKDQVFGGHGDDFLYGGAGDDKMSGDAGNDYIDGGYGDDWIWSAAGKDVLHFEANAGYDTIKDIHMGDDKIDLSSLVGFNSLKDVKAAMYNKGNGAYIKTGEHDGIMVEWVRVHEFKDKHFIYSDDYAIA